MSSRQVTGLEGIFQQLSDDRKKSEQQSFMQHGAALSGIMPAKYKKRPFRVLKGLEHCFASN